MWCRELYIGQMFTSYSCEKRRLSLAFRRSMWSASSHTEMGGCSLIPGEDRKKERKKSVE